MNTSLTRSALFVLVLLVVPVTALATVGVGVGSGKIVVQDKLHPGGIYNLTTVPVLNTGDEPSGYGLDITYLQNQVENQPPKEWFTFSPATFSLDPERVQSVEVTLVLPVKAKPGDYFAYIEAHPTHDEAAGVGRVNIAAASKLYFTIAPSNMFVGAYYRAQSFIVHNAPWTYIVFGLIVLATLWYYIRKSFSFNLGISVKRKED